MSSAPSVPVIEAAPSAAVICRQTDFDDPDGFNDVDGVAAQEFVDCEPSALQLEDPDMEMEELATSAFADSLGRPHGG